MGRLGSRVSFSASFQIFAVTAGGMSQVGREIVRLGKCAGGMSSRYTVSMQLENGRIVLKRFIQLVQSIT